MCYKLRSANTKLVCPHLLYSSKKPNYVSIVKMFYFVSFMASFRYHVPRSWLKESSNLLVLFEETGGNPLEIVVKLYSTGVICGQVSESNYPPLRKLSADYTSDGEILSSGTNPEMFLHCDDGHVISSIEFASYGTPQGSCKEFSRGHCHSTNSLSVVSEVSCPCLIFQ